VKFRSDVNGTITGIHVANLWTSSGTRLTTATFTGETASGRQQAPFSIPVSITANTVYVASHQLSTATTAPP
jgi:hypothetical protein